jgi:hypothetical protein
MLEAVLLRKDAWNCILKAYFTFSTKTEFALTQRIFRAAGYAPYQKIIARGDPHFSAGKKVQIANLSGRKKTGESHGALAKSTEVLRSDGARKG